MERRLDGKVALVTGSGGLIGPAVVRRLAAEGAAVAVTDLSLESAEKLAAGITAAGGRAFAAALDVTSPDGIASVFKAVERALGPVDILVNNAGLLRKQSAPLQQTPVETMKAIIDVNLIGTMLCCREAVGGMIARGYGKSSTSHRSPVSRDFRAGRITPPRKEVSSRSARRSRWRRGSMA